MNRDVIIGGLDGIYLGLVRDMIGSLKGMTRSKNLSLQTTHSFIKNFIEKMDGKQITFQDGADRQPITIVLKTPDIPKKKGVVAFINVPYITTSILKMVTVSAKKEFDIAPFIKKLEKNEELLVTIFHQATILEDNETFEKMKRSLDALEKKEGEALDLFVAKCMTVVDTHMKANEGKKVGFLMSPLFDALHTTFQQHPNVDKREALIRILRREILPSLEVYMENDLSSEIMTWLKGNIERDIRKALLST